MTDGQQSLWQVTPKSNCVKRRRIWEIDFLRGFCIVLMMIDHFMFDFMFLPYMSLNFYAINNPIIEQISRFATYYWHAEWRILMRVVVVSLFLFLSGVSCSFSKSNGLRAVKLSAAALGLSAATIVLDSLFDLGLTILFGVLHCLALSVVLYTLIRAHAGRLTTFFLFGMGIVLILWGISFNFYWIPEMLHYPDSLTDVLSLILGTQYYGGDSFGIVPYTGIFFMGAVAGATVYSQKKTLLPRLDRAYNRPLCFIGRHTIWIYLLHQPVIMGTVALVCMGLGYTFF